MGVFEIILIVGALASTIMGIGAMLGIPKLADPQKDATNFSGPRSNYGDSIPWVFGTQDVTSPICIWSAPVTNISPFNQRSTWRQTHVGTAEDPEVSQEIRQTDQYAVGLDMILSRRIQRNGSAHGEVRLRKIWQAQNLLWEARGFVVNSSGSLLYHDPNQSAAWGTWPGGVSDAYTVGSGWWHGGMLSDTKEVTGWHSFRRDNTLGYTEALGLESIFFYVGNGNETPNDYIKRSFSRDSTYQLYPAYSNLIRLVFQEFWVGYQPAIPEFVAQISVSCPAPEIGDNLGWISTQNQFDVNPVSLLYVLLTTPKLCGSDKLPELDIPSFSAAFQTIRSEHLGVSYTLRSPTKANELIETILGHIDGCLYREPVGGKLVLVLFRPVDASTVPIFTEASVSKISNLSKSSWLSTYGQCRVVFEHRANAANGMAAQNVAVEQDPGLIAQNGAIETLEENAPMVSTPDVASKLAARKLSVANAPLLQMNLEFTRLAEGSNSALTLRPGKVFVLNYAPLGITNLVCRVLGVDLGNLDDNSVKVSVIQDRYVPPPVVSPPTPSNPPPILPPRPDVTLPAVRVVTAPYPVARLGLTGDARRLFAAGAAALSHSTPANVSQSGDCLDRFLILAARPERGGSVFNCIVSDSNSIIRENLTIPYTSSGILQTAISATAGGLNSTYSLTIGEPIVINGLYQEDIDAIPSSEGADGRNVMLINDEWFYFTSWSQTGVGEVTIGSSSLHRMMFDSPCVPNTSSGLPSHSIGSRVWILDLRQSTTARKLSSLYKSNDFKIRTWNPVTVHSPWSTPFGHVDYSSGFGPSGLTYRFAFSNVGQTTNNLQTVLSNVVLEDRASRMLPIRRIRWTGSGTTAGYNKVSLLISSATTTVFYVSDPGSGFGNMNPRNFGNVSKMFDASAEPVAFFEESDKSLVGNWDQLLLNDISVNNTWGSSVLLYRLADHPNPTYTNLRLAVREEESGNYRIDVPAEGTTRLLEIFIYRCLLAGTGGEGAVMHLALASTPRQLRVTLNRN